MRQQPQAAARGQRDLFRTVSCLWIWGIPGALTIWANAAWGAHRISATAAGAALTASTLWIGIACYINSRRCARTHCMIDGYLLPPLGVVGLLNLAHVISISWHTYFSIFLIIVVAGFVIECFHGKYLGQGPREAGGRNKTCC
jgi:hypothetical protein